MTATVLILATVSLMGGTGDRVRLLQFQFGGSPATGLLVNLTPGARPFDPPDPTRPSVVFVHGMNPAPFAMRLTMAERLAEALAHRGAGGEPLNVLAWDWNAATVVSLHPRVNFENGIDQGRRLAASLRAWGLPPGQIHLIGQSSGSIVAASAARAVLDGSGQPVAQLTLLDPAAYYHHVIFGWLAAGSVSPRVENYWAPGPGAYGREVQQPGVRNLRVDVPGGYLGTVYMPRSAHWNVVRWYLGTVADRAIPGGFNASVTGR